MPLPAPTCRPASAWAGAFAALALALALAAACGPALAQYKVVLPDGRVTYTDRPQAEGAVSVTPLRRNGSTEAAAAGLPVELRQATQRYPVTLYAADNCSPCDAGRRLLQQRGIPYTEKRIATEEDALALERAVGGRAVPALTIGPQQLRGLSEADWTTYLDAAGYPKESRLPRNWPTPVATAMVERAPPPPRATAPAPAAADVPAPEDAKGSKVRF